MTFSHILDVLLAALKGIEAGLCPIGFVIVAALFTYRLCEETGAMQKLRRFFSSISTDPVFIVLLVVWGFGNFMEGMAGFGTAVAIPAALLAGLGFEPIKAVVLCLIANTVATGFGAVGVPMMTLVKATGLDAGELSRVAAIPLAIGGFPLPFLLVACQVGFRRMFRYLPLCLVAGLGYAVPTLVVPQVMGLELPSIIASLVVIVAVWLMRPRTVVDQAEGLGAGELLHAASPFLAVIALLTVYALALPVAVKRFVTPGAVILLGALVGGAIQRVAPCTLGQVAWATLRQARRALVTVCLILALARVLEALGVIAFLAEWVVAVFGRGYAFVATLVGVFGGALTGSGTSSCSLFGALQRDAALTLGFSPHLFAAANILGAGFGKMICPQSIAIGLAAVGRTDAGRKVLRAVLPWFVFVAIAATLLMGVASLSDLNSIECLGGVGFNTSWCEKVPALNRRDCHFERARAYRETVENFVGVQRRG